MTFPDIANRIEGALRFVPGDIDIAELPCGADVVIEMAPWRDAVYWSVVSNRLVFIACPRVAVRVTVVNSWWALDLPFVFGSITFAAAVLFCVWRAM